MSPSAFTNHGLFSDHYLATVVPSRPEWTREGRELARQRLTEVWNEARDIVVGHEGQTEEHWVRPVLRQLGFVFQVQTPVLDAYGSTRWPDYALFADESGRWSAERDRGSAAYFRDALGIADAKVWDAPLDRSRPGAGRDRVNPNYQIDAYLRETDTRWGILTNGRRWRLYSRDTSYRLDSYYEVDLISLLANEDGFGYFWAFFHADSSKGQPASFLDQVRRESQDYAEALSARVKGRVYDALYHFMNGFIAFPSNNLRAERDLQAAYENALILLYRMLFVLYSEAHGLLPMEDPAYRGTYSIARIKLELAERLDRSLPLLHTADNYYADLKSLFRIIDKGESQLGVPEYNGGLFDPAKHPFLETAAIGDSYLAEGLDLLSRVPAAEDTKVFVDYRTLEIRHLGDIYEGLLEYHPRLAIEDMAAVRDGGRETWKPASELVLGENVVAQAPIGTTYLATGSGERRATGSYYTPQEVVQQMVDASVGRLIREIETTFPPEQQADHFLDLRVCDVALGSGHFLVEVVEQISRAIVRAGDCDEGIDASGTELQGVKRRVVERCVYGVDVNPLAVELAKLSLWLATVAHDRPLSFLDAHLVCGNSLTGARLSQLGTLSNRRSGQVNFVEDRLGQVLPELLTRTEAIARIDSDTAADIDAKELLLAELNALRKAFVVAADVWTAPHFGAPVNEDLYFRVVSSLGNEDSWQETLTAGPLRAAQQVADRFRFHHWELVFPEVFLDPSRPRGFDVVITNPPYVSAIERARSHDPAESAFWRRRFDSAAGAYDLYIPYIQLSLELAREGGYASLITPNKYLAAPYARALREWICANHALTQIDDLSRVRVFEDPSVYPVISVFRAGDQAAGPVAVRVVRQGQATTLAEHPQKSLTKLPEAIWAFLLLDDADLLLAISQSSDQLEGAYGLRAVASTSTAEASAFGPELHEEHLAPNPGWKMVATGTLGPFRDTWGLDRFSHQGQRYLRPVLPFRASAVSSGRRDQYWSPKLIFKKLTLRLEAQVDPDGAYASMNTNFILPGQLDAYALGALFNSQLLNWIYEGFFGALRMSGGYLQVQAPQLRVLPVPPFDAAASEKPYAQLKTLGREALMTSEKVTGVHRRVVSEILAALDLGRRRETEPAFVLPRQRAMLEALGREDAADLSDFWRPFRSTARQLGVEVTAAREREVTRLAQRARAEMVELGATLESIRRGIDLAAFDLYGLAPEEIARVERGHNVPLGVVIEIPA